MPRKRESFLIRMAPELLERIRAYAEQRGLTLNGAVIALLDSALERRETGTEEPNGTANA